MILKGSQRSGPRQLANHLLNKDDNDHVHVAELRGFVSHELFGALAETQAIARGTKCKQCIFSLSLNPPEGADATEEDFLKVADRAERVLGLEGQPRGIVVHEKNGRRHAHVVWSRIDVETMKAVNMPHFKNKLCSLSKELYLDHGWKLPDGHRTNGWKNPLNFTLAEWQQAKSLDLDPREIKQIFKTAWAQSDNLASFRYALEEHGFFLARGNQRSVIALDIHGEVFSVGRWADVKAKPLAEKLKGFEELKTENETRADLRRKITWEMRSHLIEDGEKKEKELKPTLGELERLRELHRKERAELERKQAQRFAAENRERASRFRRGLGAVMDVLSGRLFKQRRENEREAYVGLKRDREQREHLAQAQWKEREQYQVRLESIQRRHRFERLYLGRHISAIMKRVRILDDGKRRRNDFEM